jgi:hypothetical protein
MALTEGRAAFERIATFVGQQIAFADPTGQLRFLALVFPIVLGVCSVLLAGSLIVAELLGVLLRVVYTLLVAALVNVFVVLRLQLSVEAVLSLA